MGYTTVRISQSTHQVLREIATTDGRSMQDLLAEAVEVLRRKRILEQANAAYAALRGDARAWQAVESERRLWDATLSDGLAVHEPPVEYETKAKASAKRRSRK